MDVIHTLAKFFQTGGLFMIPIAIVLGAGAAIALERYVYLRRAERLTHRLWAELGPMLKAGDLQRLTTAVADSKTALATVLDRVLKRLPTAQHRDDIEASMEEGLMQVTPRLEKRTHYLATFANIATLLGLLGTIIGLINAFEAVAGADAAEKANLLSSSISVAMNTTAFGLIAAIPMLLIHSYLQTKTAALLDTIDMASMHFLNMFVQEPGDA